MSDETPQTPLHIWASKRRDYLRKKTETAAQALILGSAALFALVSAFISMAYKEAGPWLSTWAYTAATLLGAGAICCYVSFRKVKEVKSLPYVPPIGEQIASLPASKDLLRGADQPAASTEELLRAAHSGADTEAAELLRAGDGITR